MKISDLDSNEYNEYYQLYLNYLPELELIHLLEILKTEFVTFLEGLTQEDLKKSYADGKWTVAESLQHMIDTERIFQYRALSIARKDTVSLPGFDHENYARSSAAGNRKLSGFVREFTAVRDAGIALFESFDDRQLKEKGEANNSPLSVRAAAFIIAGHQKHHQMIFKMRYEL